jgi:phage tail-like protein
MSDRQLKNYDDDPFANYQFRVEIEGIEVFGFKEVLGLSNKTDVYEYQEGGQNKFTHRFAGQTTFSNLTLKKGMVLDQSIYEWRKQVIDGNLEDALRDITIILISEKGSYEKELSWRFYDTWPCKWEASTFDSMANAIGIETLELALSMGEEVER